MQQPVFGTECLLVFQSPDKEDQERLIVNQSFQSGHGHPHTVLDWFPSI